MGHELTMILVPKEFLDECAAAVEASTTPATVLVGLHEAVVVTLIVVVPVALADDIVENVLQLLAVETVVPFIELSYCEQ